MGCSLTALLANISDIMLNLLFELGVPFDRPGAKILTASFITS